MKLEVWKPIEDYENYEVSDMGNVRSIQRYVKHRTGIRNLAGKTMKARIKKKYEVVGLVKNFKQKTFQVHRLVARTFIPNPLNKPEVNHKDCNTCNNKVDNLEWVTREENMQHAKENNRLMICERKINQYTKDGTFIKEWDSIQIAGKTLKVNRDSIICCCQRESRHAGGYMWEYVEE